MQNLFLKLNKDEIDSGVEIYSLGYIQNENMKRLKEQDILALYNQYGKNLYKYLDGIYTVVIVDKIKKKLYVFQDFFGCNYSVYFFIDEKQLIVSNELKRIVLELDEELVLDEKSVKEFLVKGYIPNKHTLIRNINKIPGQKYLEVDLKNFKAKLNKSKLVLPFQSEEVTKDIYNKTFEKSCMNCENPSSTTISSGYDSNYILNTIRKNYEGEISAFVIGGVIGRNEIPIAKTICEKYEKVNFYSRLVDGLTFNKFPEIVWALEGSVYESGIFLQYELAKLLKDCNITNITLGECADQVLDYELYHSIYAVIKKIEFILPRIIKRIVKKVHFKPYKDVYEMASYKVIKKNGILLNYFNVSGDYPFLSKKFLAVAKKVSKKGDKSKSFHKEVVKSQLGEEIGSLLKKIGGATELKALFVGDITLENIKDFCKQSNYYKEKEFDDQFYAIDYFMKILYVELFKKLFIQDRCKIKNIKNFELIDFFKKERL